MSFKPIINELIINIAKKNEINIDDLSGTTFYKVCYYCTTQIIPIEFKEREKIRKNNKEKIMKLIYENPNIIIEKNNNGETILEYIILANHLDIAKYLLENGADIESKDNNGNSILLTESFNTNLNTIIWLVENGANIEAKNNEGWNAPMCALHMHQYLFIEEYFNDQFTKLYTSRKHELKSYLYKKIIDSIIEYNIIYNI